MNIQRKTEKGNVLWFILIAVALLAALTMVLSRSGSTVDQSGDIEQQRIKASEVLRYAKSIETGIQQMRLRGVSENDLSFWHDSNGDSTEDGSDTYYNAGCTTTDCKLFDAGGAGLVFAAPPSGVNDGSAWTFVATNDVVDVGTTRPDLLIILPVMKTSVCSQINRLTGASYAGTESDVDFTAFTGTFTATESIDLAAGQEAGCIDYDNAGTTEPFFYQVLIKR
ncbi:MAG: hypothetical protein H6861_07940 [Rhodospirillales bacterium]|nr:hypothetical protein [Rhodospirillales bacterium]